MNSAQGFQTTVWGPAAWLFLHCVSLNYHPEKQKRAYKQFFKSLAGVLPCGSCRDNYRRTITRHKRLRLTDDVFRSRESLSLWLFKLHNYVRKCQTNKEVVYPNTKAGFRHMVSEYSRFRARCPKKGAPNPRQIHTKHGCTQPLNGGIRLRSVIRIVQHKRT